MLARARTTVQVMIVLLAAVIALQASGQSGTSSALAGNVADKTGAAIPNAQVKATEVNTGAVRRVREQCRRTLSLLPSESRNLPN